jgi:hypothetical protein
LGNRATIAGGIRQPSTVHRREEQGRAKPAEFSRPIRRDELGNNGARLIEIIASPLSNLSGLNGIATSTPKYKPKKFPDPKALQIPGWKAAAVRYDKAFAVETESGHPGSAYPRRRTKEHFMTVSFCRSQKGVELSADAWRIRERSGPSNMPVKDFKKSFTVTLK